MAAVWKLLLQIKKVARDVAAEEWGVHPESAAALSFKVTVLRPYEETPSQASSGDPIPGSTLDRARQRAAAAQQREYQIYDTDNGRAVVAFMAADDEAATARVERYRREHPGEQVGLRRAGNTTQARQIFTGYWDVRIDNEVVFRVQAETQGEANNKAREWLSQRSPEFRQQHQGGEVTVTPRYE